MALIGQDIIPPDLVAKVTGRAKYAEDFRADGMLFCRLLTSPMPHARVRNIDASRALKMKGVVAVLTADEVPSFPPPPIRPAPRKSTHPDPPSCSKPKTPSKTPSLTCSSGSGRCRCSSAGSESQT